MISKKQGPCQNSFALNINQLAGSCAHELVSVFYFGTVSLAQSVSSWNIVNQQLEPEQ